MVERWLVDRCVVDRPFAVDRPFPVVCPELPPLLRCDLLELVALVITTPLVPVMDIPEYELTSAFAPSTRADARVIRDGSGNVGVPPGDCRQGGETAVVRCMRSSTEMTNRGNADPATEWQRARELISAARRITALTGAGVSTASGIPDFRGPDGVWTKNPAAQRLTDIDSYRADPEVRKEAWRSRAENPAWQAQPSEAHRAFVDLAESGRLGSVLTQNIDELHQRAGLSPDLVVELHGSMFGTVCLSCPATGTMRAALERVAAGEEDPACPVCGGVMKSATISFGQALDEQVVRRGRAAALDCDVFVAAGTSLSVFPAAGFAELAVKAGAGLIICNAEPTPYDELAAAVLREPLVDVLPALAAVPYEESSRPLRTWGDPSTWS